MATIYDVAAAAGVSPKTVSRVLNGEGPVGRKTREAVETAMAGMGYVPSNAARMMRSNRSGLVGVITGAISTADEARPTGLPELVIVQGIQRVMAERGMTMMIADTGDRSDTVPALVETFLRHRVEGLIYVAEYHRKVTLPAIPKDTPVVLANCYDDAGTTCILPDDEQGQRDLVTRLIAAGHRRIAYLTLMSHLDATRLRTAGYRAALEAAGIAHDPALVTCCETTSPEAETRLLHAAVERLMRLPEPPTVLCCGNDKMALKLYGILRSRGTRVPDDVSVAGYDNHRVIAETLYPPLSTIELAYGAMGGRAAELLLSLIRGEAAPDAPVLVRGPVYWRSSVTALGTTLDPSTTSSTTGGHNG
ncbi:MAG: LacI family DNA-binding transcriptional regulator [Rubellimicrobium sp.]|nr:LacI family DNA-binding transcriptional regulator [Rubellimicrobium sp.]